MLLEKGAVRPPDEPQPSGGIYLKLTARGLRVCHKEQLIAECIGRIKDMQSNERHSQLYAAETSSPAPWNGTGSGFTPKANWPSRACSITQELFDLSNDWTQSEDVAAKYPVARF